MRYALTLLGKAGQNTIIGTENGTRSSFADSLESLTSFVAMRGFFASLIDDTTGHFQRVLSLELRDILAPVAGRHSLDSRRIAPLLHCPLTSRP